MNYYQSKGNVLASPLNDREALRRCGKLQSKFARDLVNAHGRKGKLTRSQWYHVHKMATQKPKQEFKSNLYNVLDSPFSFAESVRKRLPRLFFPSVGIDIYRAQKGRHVGCFQVCNGQTWRDRRWYATITPDRVVIGPRCPEDVKAFLQRSIGFADMLQAERNKTGVCPLCNQRRKIGKHCKRVWGL